MARLSGQCLCAQKFLLSSKVMLRPGLFNALSERGGASGAVKDVFLLSEGDPV